jgi:beta-N-acetylhexosaminidase
MMEHKTTAGPILIGIAGTELDATGREHLCHPAVGGVVLFSRNYACRAQLLELVTQIRTCCQPRPLVCIDQEGGRVQRLREEFTALPPLGVLGAMYATNPDRALDYCYRHARVMAAEILACGIDLSFAPVLDLDRGSLVIGDRSFSDSLEVVCDLGRTYLAGMHDAGMKATGKHFPGHGSVLADSHSDDVIDDRSLAELERTDLVPFIRLAPQLDALMIAHVVYPQVDPRPAGYSRKWLGDYLRGSLGYKGVIMSDDLGMHAAHVAGNLVERCLQSLQAGCDLVLACQPADVEELLGSLDRSLPDASRAIASLYGMVREDFAELETAATQGAGEWRQWQQSLESLGRAQVESGKYTGVS